MSAATAAPPLPPHVLADVGTRPSGGRGKAEGGAERRPRGRL